MYCKIEEREVGQTEDGSMEKWTEMTLTREAKAAEERTV